MLEQLDDPVRGGADRFSGLPVPGTPRCTDESHRRPRLEQCARPRWWRGSDPEGESQIGVDSRITVERVDERQQCGPVRKLRARWAPYRSEMGWSRNLAGERWRTVPARHRSPDGRPALDLTSPARARHFSICASADPEFAHIMPSRLGPVSRVALGGACAVG